MKKIALRFSEVAEAYMMRTLNEYLHDKIDEKIHMYVPSGRTNLRNIIPKYIADQRGLMYLEPDLVIGPYSDVFTNMKRYEGGPYRTFAIDAAILKACKPVPDEQGIRILKQKYNIQTNKPIFTIGFYPYGDDHKELDDIINSTINSTQIVIVATGDTSVKEHYLNNIDKDKIIEVVGRGMLSELYAISDISLSANHTIRYNSQLKNFFEMTQGGPTFMVPTTQNKQYGYKHFVEQGYVIECRNVRSMINKINKHLKNITP
ncbi:MAG TPA: hypothetical protein VEC16_05905, partial [Alphaproteobacteria bacterium]|nr:hypothetical protein [Alphaproteobacteria bacterium]